MKVIAHLPKIIINVVFIMFLSGIPGLTKSDGAVPFEKQNIGEFGSVLGRHADFVDDGIVERVVIYAKESDCSDKKIPRAGILVRYPNAIGTVLVSHGFMCDKYDVGMLRQLFPKGKLNVFSWDFRAHGEHKQGQVCTFGKNEAYDVIAAAQFAKNHPFIKDKPVIVYGFSMGAVAAIQAQAKDPSLFKGMILDCPFDSTENVLRRGLDQVKFSLFGYEFHIPGRSVLQKYAFHPYVQTLVKGILKTVAHMDSKDVTFYLEPIHTADAIKTLSVPLLMIHCKKDEKVSVEAMKDLYASAGADYKLLWLTNGRRHYDSYFYNPEKYTQRVRLFIDQVIAGSLDKVVKKEVIEEPDDSRFEIV